MTCSPLLSPPEETGIPPPRLALPVGLAFEAAREKLAPEEPPEKRAVLMGSVDPPRLGAPPSFLPRGKVPLRGEEGLVSEGLWACVPREDRLHLMDVGGGPDRSSYRQPHSYGKGFK